MQGIAKRKACFRTVIALILNGEEHLFEGRADGEILTEQHGNAGFGYDPISVPKDMRKALQKCPQKKKIKSATEEKLLKNWQLF